jgi:hypothetical protein
VHSVRSAEGVVNALAVLLHPGELLHPMRRYQRAAGQIAEALDHDRHWNPAAIQSVQDGARHVHLAATSVQTCVWRADIDGGRHAVIETAVAAIRLAAERPDPLRADPEQAYQIAAANAWADLLGEQEGHLKGWASPVAGVQELISRARRIVRAADQFDVAAVEVTASLTAAACIRYLAEVQAAAAPGIGRRGKAA